MGSKFFKSFQVKAEALKKCTTRWANEDDHSGPPCPAYLINVQMSFAIWMITVCDIGELSYL